MSVETSEATQLRIAWMPTVAEGAKVYCSQTINGTNYQIQVGYREDGFVVWRNLKIEE